ncbi:MAG: hypothetical protein AAGI53_08835 [Planctomycetota bacterium]
MTSTADFVLSRVGAEVLWLRPLRDMDLDFTPGMIHEFVSASWEYGVNRIVIDLRGIGSVDTDEQRREFVAGLDETGLRPDHRIVVLVGHEATVHETCPTAMRELGFRARSFVDTADAIDWLFPDDRGNNQSWMHHL